MLSNRYSLWGTINKGLFEVPSTNKLLLGMVLRLVPQWFNTCYGRSKCADVQDIDTKTVISHSLLLSYINILLWFTDGGSVRKANLNLFKRKQVYLLCNKCNTQFSVFLYHLCLIITFAFKVINLYFQNIISLVFSYV